MRDNNTSPHPVENQAAPLIQADPSLLAPNMGEFYDEHSVWSSLPPSTTDSQYADKSPPRSKPLFRGFEKPSFSRIAILTVLCLVTYPAFYVLTFVAKDRSLFIVRLVVSLWCSGVGFALGYILLKIGAQHLEATSESTLVGYMSRLSKALFQTAWATVIHMSHEGGGMKLRDLARTSGNPTSFTPAFHIFWSRFGNRDQISKRSRGTYEFVLGSSSALLLLTLLQQTTMVTVLDTLRCSRHPSSPVTLPIRAHHRDQNVCRCTCHRPVPSLYFLIPE